MRDGLRTVFLQGTGFELRPFLHEKVAVRAITAHTEMSGRGYGLQKEIRTELRLGSDQIVVDAGTPSIGTQRVKRDEGQEPFHTRYK